MRIILSLVSTLPNFFHFHAANSFSTTTTKSKTPSSSSSPKVVQVRPLQTKDDHDHEPIILFLPDILSPNQTSNMLQTVESSIQNGDLVSTSSYQEDIFSKDKWEGEDSALFRIVQPLLEDDLIPSEYNMKHNHHHLDGDDDGDDDPDAALQAFVYAVTNYQERLSEDDIILGANIIQRRQAIERWKSEDGQAIMKLSLDDNDDDDDDIVGKTNEGEVDWEYISLGKRYELPPLILEELEQLIPRLLLHHHHHHHGSSSSSSWITRDATLVKYSEGDTQVPHIDPCDATLLICLKGCDEGGGTCFPSLERPLRLENKEGCGMLFFSSNKIRGDDSRDALSLHHGGKVVKGEKIVVQLMLDWNVDLVKDDNIPPSGSWLDVVVDNS